MSHQHYDFVVIGGGIAGLSAAYIHQCLFPQHKVLVLERNASPDQGKKFKRSGTSLTRRSGGHLMPGFEAHHDYVMRLVGAENADRLYSGTLEASAWIQQTIHDENINCGLHRGYWIVDSDKRKLEGLEQFMLPRRRMGLPEPAFFGGEDLKRQIDLGDYNAGLYFPDIASIDPALFIDGLAEAFTRRGGQILYGHEYKGCDKLGSGRYCVSVVGTRKFEANRVLLAGGDSLTRHVSQMHARTFPIYTARAVVHLPEDAFNCVSPQGVVLDGCDADLRNPCNDPLGNDFLWFSLRRSGQRSGGDFVMGFGGCFGGDEQIKRRIKGMLADVREELVERLPFLRGNNPDVRIAIGALNAASNMLPIVGRLEEGEDVYAIAAQAGIGLVQSAFLGQTLNHHFAGVSGMYNLLTRFREDQAPIPTGARWRPVALEAAAMAHKILPPPVFNGAVKGYTRAAGLIS